MRDGQPSLTARGAAVYRAIHQTHDGAAIFRDPFALGILDAETRATLDEIAADPSRRGIRLFIASRSRFSEEALAASVARGTRQIVVLGAGLDTFSLRNPYPNVGVFEVDFPATQVWKRERLREADIATPETLIFAPVDFERESLAGGLTRAGFRRDQPAFFQWLGVSMYLTRETVFSTLDFIASVPGSAVAFDYTEPFENQSPERRASLTAMAGSAAARGEPWLSLFDPPEIAAILREKGFGDIEDLGFADLIKHYSPELGRGLQPGGGHVIRAAR